MEQLRVLYLTYDGALEPLGRSQVVEYLIELSHTHVVHLISFERSSDLDRVRQVEDLRQLMTAAGIRWYPLRYHKRPAALATVLDIVAGLCLALWIAMRHRTQVFHARSYVMGLVALVSARLTGAKFLFDMRGFWPDEKVEMGHWSREGGMYRMFKRIERMLFQRADGVVSLTQSGVEQLQKLKFIPRHTQVAVIPTCTNVSRFAVSDVARQGFTVAYFGSTTRWYRFDLVLEAFKAIAVKRSDARLMIVTRDDTAELDHQLRLYGVQNRCTVLMATYDEVPSLMQGVDLGVFFITPSFSKLGSSPTKLAELLASGVPCLSNMGVGDYGHLIRRNGLGVCVDELTPAAVREGALSALDLLEVDAEIRKRCRSTAVAELSHTIGARLYDQMYRKLAGGASRN